MPWRPDRCGTGLQSEENRRLSRITAKDPAVQPVSHNPDFLQQAQQQATLALYLSNPNPRVGCVIVAADGTLLGQGHTQQAGGPHAEIMALRDAAARGIPVRGATAYVTLEPCCHQGRTGPCCEALIEAGVARVVASLRDPNPKVAGQGFARLQAAGIGVTLLAQDAPLAQQARALNIGFFSRMLRQTPWVRMKIAASLDGKTALPDGSSQWITSEPARRDGHAWRARACALLTGIGTVLHDRPRLDVRLVATPRQPHLVIVDSDLQTPPDAPCLDLARKVFVYCARAPIERAAALTARGVHITCLPASDTPQGAPPRVDLRAMLQDLGRREINELHVEAGQTLNGALLQADLVDELLLYVAPKLLAQGLEMARWDAPVSLAAARTLHFSACELLGPDLRINARVSDRDNF